MKDTKNGSLHHGHTDLLIGKHERLSYTGFLQQGQRMFEVLLCRGMNCSLLNFDNPRTGNFGEIYFGHCLVGLGRKGKGEPADC